MEKLDITSVSLSHFAIYYYNLDFIRYVPYHRPLLTLRLAIWLSSGGEFCGGEFFVDDNSPFTFPSDVVLFENLRA